MIGLTARRLGKSKDGLGASTQTGLRSVQVPRRVSDSR